jgi:PIN domain nuclease of toxin-antitoxin system
VSGASGDVAVVDTHALIWWLTGKTRRLGRHARTFLDRVDRGNAIACFPTIVLVELGEAVQLGAISLSEPFGRFVSRLASTPSRYRILPLTEDVVVHAHDLFAISERGDRLIAATALAANLPILTRDPAIASAAALRRIW